MPTSFRFNLALALIGLLACAAPRLAQAQPVGSAGAATAAAPATVAVGLVAPLGEHTIAILKRSRGKVELVRGGQVTTPVVGEYLRRADMVRTGAQSAAGISFIDGTTLAVDADSTVELSRYAFAPDQGQFDFDLYLQRGAAIYASGKLGKLAPAAVQVRTPNAVIGVRGTRFHVSAE
jgi:hypothetical protein